MKNFVFRMVNLLLISGVLLCYQQNASARQVEVEAYEKKQDAYEQAVAEIEAQTRQSQSADAENETAGSYTDGVYEGSGSGFGGTITVKVTVQNGNISDIELLAASGEDQAYLSQAAAVIYEIIDQQETDVDAVSGATFSSNGIISAVKDALEE